jgi:GNAT superfamily N-acetyltransferase
VEPQIRRATVADAPAIAALERAARAAAAEARGGPEHLAEHPAVRDWHELLAHPGDIVVFVATLDDVVFGYLAVRTASARHVITDVFVDDGARELGLGDGLVAAAIDHARSRGAQAIESSALPGDRQTKNLFERAGLTARKIIVARRLGEG